VDVGRRRLLTGAAATFVGLLVGCGDDDDDGDDAATTTNTTARATSTTTAAARLPSDPFTLGVASGDPTTDGVVLWTRLAPDPLAADGLGAMPNDDLDIQWEVAEDDRFARVITSGVVTAEAAHAHAVHVVVDGLDAAADVHYRFRVGEFTSPVGRTRTLPDGSPDRFALAVANCQWLETGQYGAYRNMLDEDLDLVLHLGDYIYEYPGAESPRSAQPFHPLANVADYRLRYASYRLDPHLRAAHARFPFVLTWDDHEVANNHNGAELADLRAAAYQAWWEHQPVRVDAPTGPALAVHQMLAVGDLATITMLDERQYSDVPPCRDSAAGDYGDCEARTGADRSLLGSDQEQFFSAAVERADATWFLVGNPVVLAGVDGGNDADGSAYYLDTWDGFPSARHRFIDTLAGASNPVVLTGDYHAGMVLDVHRRPFEDSEVVAAEFMSPAISSPLFPADVSARTPHLRQQINNHGYLRVDVEPERLTATFRVLDDVQRANSPITTAATWVVDAGDPVAHPA
jgi:alkaline phosphatase D